MLTHRPNTLRRLGLCLCFLAVIGSSWFGFQTPQASSDSPGSEFKALTARPVSRFENEFKQFLQGSVTPLAVSLSAVKSAAVTTDTGCTGASPGDTLTYTVTLSNSGSTAATGVTFTDMLDANTTLVGGSLKVSPLAIDDSYNTIGNVTISVPVAQGVIGNDTNPGGSGTLTVTQVNAVAVPGTATTTHGSVTMAADGSFTYTPTAGYSGPTDIFTYTLGNGSGLTDTATVTINLSGRIWFVNSAAGAGGDGRLNTPFNSLASVFGVDAAGDNIFLYTGSYTGGVTLKNSEKLIGQGANSSLLTITGLSAPSGTNLLPATNGTDPTISAAGTNLTVGTGNAIHGVTITGTAAAATNLSGTSFGTLTVRDTTINGMGRTLNLTTGTADLIFDAVTTSSSSTTGLSLTTVTGTLAASGGSISGVTGGACVSISGGSVAFNTFDGGITQSSNNPLLSVSGGHTGSLTFQTGTVSATNGTGLQFDNADGTYNFNGTTTLNGGDAGVDILNGSTGTFTFGTGTTITNPSGVGFNLSGATASNANVTYSGNISKNNAGFAIDIDNHDSGTVTFQTGTISSTGTSSGIRVQNSNGGTINFNSPTKTLTTDTNTAVTLNTNNGGGTMNFGNGGLAITTTSGTGFSATGGGTVNVTGSGNTISSTSGATALNIANTTIGSSNLNFQSISSNGGSAPGIVLDSTGSSGGLIVNGDGTNTTRGGNSTGGTISNKDDLDTFPDALGNDGLGTVGTGIFLNNTQNITLRRMTINGTNQNFGIRGTNVTNFVMEYCSVVGTNGDSTPAREGSVVFDNLFGNTNSVFESIISGSIEDNFRIENTSGTLSSFNLTNSTIQNNSTVSGNIGFRFATVTTGVSMTGMVSGCTFQGNRTDAINSDASNGTVNITITNNIIIAGTGGNNQGNIGIDVTVANNGVMNFAVEGNKVGTPDGTTPASLLNDYSRECDIDLDHE